MRITPRMFGAIAAIVVILDQATKFWAVARLTVAFETHGAVAAAASFQERLSRFLWVEHPAPVRAITVLEDFWHFRYAENEGAAFSFLASSDSGFRTPFFLAVTVLAMGAILLYFRKSHPAQHLLRLALGLVLGGAIGNFIDRARLGYVIDFIVWHWYDKAAWPTFNVADSAISTGVVLLLIGSFMREPADQQATATPTTSS